jgi:hypothetical protein
MQHINREVIRMSDVMGKFEDAIPKSISQLEANIRRLRQESVSLDWGHKCDCVYCTEQTDVPEETEARDAEISTEIKDIKLAISRLKRHAVANGIEVE